MMHGRDVVIISSVDWEFLWQAPQEIATRLSRNGNRVLYVENSGVRAPRLRDAPRVAHRLRSWAAGGRPQGLRKESEGLYICSPVLLPPFSGRITQSINRNFLVPAVTRAATEVEMRHPVVWTFLPTDTAMEMIRRFRTPESAVVYYCAADFGALVRRPDAVEASERRLLQVCDLAFATCRELAAKCARACLRTHVFPYGIDLEAFPATASESGAVSAPGLAGLPRPVIGYAGGLHRHFDFALVAEMARLRPNWSFVLVGTRQADTRILESAGNVVLVGTVPHARLHSYLRAFDVGIVPYRHSPYTRTVVPAKINEYLAMGKPVVAVNLPPVIEFAAEHPGTVFTAEPDTDGFLAAIERALRLPADPASLGRRRAVAALADWRLRLEQMTELIESRAG